MKTITEMMKTKEKKFWRMSWGRDIFVLFNKKIVVRHCEQSEAIHMAAALDCRAALAMTTD
jgi:hypothetical protein